MSVSMQKMWISIIGMGLFLVAMFAIYITRYKLKNKFLKIVTSIVAWLSLIVGGIIMLYIVLAGPTY
ncbi:DUF2768 domain-containing protein [Bacillus niameyensis]|uniref:DUF2768 domain-containing protein n=1 Tax=Bacillus niameyensis TaxID=1522308 RepID=UPI0007821D12|nr:DUF2768 domain-containing protein [Bacillus niameyensis]